MKFNTILFISFFAAQTTIMQAVSVETLLKKTTELCDSGLNDLRLEETDARNDLYRQAHQAAINVGISRRTSVIMQYNPKAVTVHNRQLLIRLAFIHTKNLQVIVANGGTASLITTRKKKYRKTNTITTDPGSTLINDSYNRPSQFKKTKTTIQRIHRKALEDLYNKTHLKE